MDEPAKTEARNYLSAAGFFTIAAYYLLLLFSKTGTGTSDEQLTYLHLFIGATLLILATLLFVLHKRDMTAIIFVMMGAWHLFCACTPLGTWNIIVSGFLFILSLATLTSYDKQKWLLFLIPLIWVAGNLIIAGTGYNSIKSIVFLSILTVLCLYYACACASERIHLPGRTLLTADETTAFKASGSVLGYLLFALITGGYTLHYLLGESVLPLATFVTVELVCGALMVFVAILLLAVGRMRFTPVMFLLIGLTNIMSVYATGMMWIGIGILFIVIGLWALLRTESRILPGCMLIIYGCTAFFTAYASGSLISAPAISVILNAVPCLIAIYLAFATYSQRKMPLV